MKLDRTTYELFIIDYLEGNLDPVQVSELLLFLEQNPDLKAEFDGVEQVYLVHDDYQETFPTSSLKKEENPLITAEVEELLIGEVEQNLTTNQRLKLDELRAVYPAIEKELKLMQATKLDPDMSVTFSNKRSLKKYQIRPLYYYYGGAVAAVFIAVVFSGVWFSASKAPFVTNSSVALGSTTQSVHASSKSITLQQPMSDVSEVKTADKKQVVSNSTSSALFVQPLLCRHQNVVPKHSQWVAEKPELLNVQLPATLAFNPNKQPVQPAPTADYMDAKEWVKQEVTKRINNSEALNSFNLLNRVGFSLERDTTGRVKRVELAALGFALQR